MPREVKLNSSLGQEATFIIYDDQSSALDVENVKTGHRVYVAFIKNEAEEFFASCLHELAVSRMKPATAAEVKRVPPCRAYDMEVEPEPIKSDVTSGVIIRCRRISVWDTNDFLCSCPPGHCDIPYIQPIP